MKTGNELIAEFMGGIFYGTDDLDHPNKWRFKNQPHEGYRKDAHHISDFLRYDKDWSWLMPVVEKIESMGYCARIVRSGGERCVIYDPEIHNSADVYIGKGFGVSINQEKKIDAVFKAVVEFIKWHNSQRNEP